MRSALTKVPASVRVAAALSTTLTLTLAAAVGTAMSAPGPATLALAPTGVLDYASDDVVFRPVGLGLLQDVFGGGGSVGGGSGSDLIASGGDTVIPIDRGSDPVLPEPSETPDPDPDPRESDDPPITIERPILRITFEADRRTAGRNEKIRYTAVVRNVGGATASNVRIESHVPEHTTYAGVDNCDGESVQVLPGDGPVACVDGDDVVPPDNYAPYEHFGKTFTKLLPGEVGVFSFFVRVNGDAEHGIWLINHAHATAVNALGVDSREVSVIVE